MMSDSDKSSLVNEFAEIADVNDERAKYYLESAAWNMDSAMAIFFEEQSDLESKDDKSKDESNDEGSNDDGSKDDESKDDESKDDKSHDIDNAGQTSSTAASASNSDVPSVVWQKPILLNDSIVSIVKKTKNAGGSVTSGKLIFGPSRPQGDMINAMLQTAHKFYNDSAPTDNANASGETNFFGTGYRLGMTEDDTEVIPSTIHQPISTHQEVTIKLWREGFTVNDGELHLIEQKKNREFLNSMLRGKKIPSLILKQFNVATLDNIDLSVEDHRHEDYKPYEKLLGGSGNLLESSAPEAVETLKDNYSDNGVANETAARAEVPLSPDAPITSVHIRLADGTRLVAKFNHSHTVADIRRYIIAARSGFGFKPFKLQSSFPPKTLDHDKQTLFEAGLLNSVIFQRIG